MCLCFVNNCKIVFFIYKHYSNTEALKTVHVPPDGKWNLKFPQELVENKTRENQRKSENLNLIHPVVRNAAPSTTGYIRRLP